MTAWMLKRWTPRAARALALALTFQVAGPARSEGPPGPAPAPAPADAATRPAALFAATPARDVPPPVFVPGSTRVVMSPLDVIRESIFGEASKDNWEPLSLGTFFSEGWNKPYYNSPEGTNLAPKQNWMASPAGVFGRFFTVDTFYTHNIHNVPGLFMTPNTAFMPVHTNTTGS